MRVVCVCIFANDPKTKFAEEEMDKQQRFVGKTDTAELYLKGRTGLVGR